jgi:hypothetical protein
MTVKKRSSKENMPPIILKSMTHQRLVEFATATGKTVSSSADEAINEWMDYHGEPIVRRLKERENHTNGAGRLLPFRSERKM